MKNAKRSEGEFYRGTASLSGLQFAWQNQNIESFPKNIYDNGVKISENNVPDTVAEFFDNKVKRLVRDSAIDPNIYNGRQKILSDNVFFMGKEAVLDCVASLKIKNSEGYDRVPQRIIKD